MKNNFLFTLGVIILISSFNCRVEASSGAARHTVLPKPNTLFTARIANGADLIKCFPGIEDRINGGLNSLQHTMMSLLSTKSRLDEFVFNLTKALGARTPTRNATEVPHEMNDQTPEILAVSNIFRLFAAARSIHLLLADGSISLIDFKSTVSTYVKLATDYVSTLLPLLQNSKLKKLHPDIVTYTNMLNSLNAEILPILEQLEDLYVRPTSEDGCHYFHRLKWSLNNNDIDTGSRPTVGSSEDSEETPHTADDEASDAVSSPPEDASEDEHVSD